MLKISYFEYCHCHDDEFCLKVFGNATVYGLPTKSLSIAEQPVGFASAKQAAQERINTLRKSGFSCSIPILK